MKIGIDLDNTIIDYTPAFNKYVLAKKILNKKNFNYPLETFDKSYLKSKILELKNGEIEWQKIQGQIYGKFINLAKIYPGFHRFLLLAKNRKIEIFIISHKTYFGHFDKHKIPLRKVALKFLEKNLLFNNELSSLLKHNIYFADTRQKKIEIINKLNLDYFIDDLKEVLLHPHFNKKTKKILINNNKIISNNKISILSNWGKINNYFFKKYSSKDIKMLLKILKINNSDKIKKIKGGINSTVYKITKNNKNICLKIYPINSEKKNRHINEFKSFQILRKNNIYTSPIPLNISNNLQISSYSWLKGKKLKILKEKNINNLLNFFMKLKKLSDNTNISKLNYASESSVNILNIYNYNKIRILKLKKLNYDNKTLIDHLNLIEDTNNKNNIYLKKFIRKNRVKTILPKKNLLLSPSDVSLKNIINLNNRDFYIDFEYFGWDDPCKTLSDIIWHPSMKISSDIYDIFINRFSKIFEEDSLFKERLINTFNLYGVRWSLIMLNIFNNIKFENHKISKKIDLQLKKSKKTIENVLYDKYKCKYLKNENF